MFENFNAIKNCILFKNFETKEIRNKLTEVGFDIKYFDKNEIIAIEDDDCKSIGIVLKGNVEIQKIYASGKVMTIEKLHAGDIFGEVIIFSNHHKYPATILSSNKSQIMFISKESILNLCSSSNIFLNNFMELLSSKILKLNKKLKIMSYKTIKQKIVHYLLDEYKKQKKAKIRLNCTKKELAERLGIPRPSLSRELIQMKNDKIIDFDKEYITILNFEKLEDVLLD